MRINLEKVIAGIKEEIDAIEVVRHPRSGNAPFHIHVRKLGEHVDVTIGEDGEISYSIVHGDGAHGQALDVQHCTSVDGLVAVTKRYLLEDGPAAAARHDQHDHAPVRDEEGVINVDAKNLQRIADAAESIADSFKRIATALEALGGVKS